VSAVLTRPSAEDVASNSLTAFHSLFDSGL